MGFQTCATFELAVRCQFRSDGPNITNLTAQPEIAHNPARHWLKALNHVQ